MKTKMKAELSDNVSNGSFTSENSQNSSDVGQRNIILVSLDGIQSGVPTLTTSTLTPTTLRNIEQTFIELTSDPPVSAPYQAGFVPPLAPYNHFDNNDNNSLGSSDSDSESGSWHSPMLHEENSMATTDTSSVATSINPSGSPSLPTATTTASASNNGRSGSTRRNVGGRRPNKQSNLSPEEEEKRKVRRERNKLAAARCRKRRVDQTNELIEKVDQLEKEKDGLQKKIDELQFLKEDLQLCLESHRTHCRLQGSVADTTLIRSASPLDVKPEIVTTSVNTIIFPKSIKAEPIDDLDGPSPPKRIMLSSNNPTIIVPPLPNVSTISSTIPSTTTLLNTPTIIAPPAVKPNRPSSLNVPLAITPSQALGLGKNVSDISGVPITTPSSGVMFNFDSLMDGGTGLTPVAAPLMPNCSSQNKHPLELTTPTSEPSKLVSL